MDYLQRTVRVDPRLVVPVVCACVRWERRAKKLVRVTGGLRTKEEQRKLVAAGKSRTMKSYHVRGRALDLAILDRTGAVAYWEHDLFEDLNAHIQYDALEMGVMITWGGHWSSLVDAVHWQLETIESSAYWSLPDNSSG